MGCAMAGITIKFSRGYGFSSKLVSVNARNAVKVLYIQNFSGGGGRRGRMPPSPSRVRYWRSYSNLCLLYSSPKVKTLAIQLYFNRFMFKLKRCKGLKYNIHIQFTLLHPFIV